MEANVQDGPIFVVGSARSGTTLLQRMLRSHPRVSSPTGESQFIIPLQRRLKEFGDLGRLENVRRVIAEMHRISPEFMETDLHGIPFDIDEMARQLHARGRTTMDSIISGLFELNAEGEGKSRWLDKTPYYTLHLKMLLDIFPDAKVIHIIRDGRDCALSMLARKYDLHIYNIYMAATTWKRYVDAGQKFGDVSDPGAYHEFCYEDLLHDPERVMRGVCSFLGEEFSERVVEFDKSRDKKSKTPLLAKPLQQDNKEKWRRHLSARQIRHFEALAGDTLARNGYEIVNPDTRGLQILPEIFYRIHGRVMDYAFRK